MKLLELQDARADLRGQAQENPACPRRRDSEHRGGFVLGEPIDEEGSNPERLKSSMAQFRRSIIVHYDSLIRGAQEAYSEFLKKSKQLDKLERIVDRI
jgi:hypothetical protein